MGQISKEDYVARCGNVCPVCGSHEVTGDNIEVDGSQAWQEVSCDQCGATWQDVYQLIGYDNLCEGEEHQEL